jgi:KDO2-lipid IV(A) lauroyltransferase
VGWLILLFLRAISWGYWFLPAALRVGCGDALGFLLRRLALRRKIVGQNLSYAFPREIERRQALVKDAYRHLGRLTLEILLLLGPMRRFVLRHAELRGAETWRKAHESGKGVIFLSSHVGNWEVMAAAGATHGGMDLMLVTKKLKPAWLHRAIEAGRARCGVKATYEPRTLKDVLAHLKAGGTVGFVLDQYSGPPVGVRVPVFGIPVGTSMAIATIARRTGAVVLPVVNYRDPSGRSFVVEIRETLAWEKSEDSQYELAANTAAYAAVLEKDILAHTDQWLWIHRRFKGDLSPLRLDEWAAGRARS